MTLHSARLRAAAVAPQPIQLPENGELIVKFREGETGSFSVSAAATVANQGGAVVHEDQQFRMVVKLPADPAQATALIAALRDRPDVAYVENNDVMEAFDADPSLGELWGLTRMKVPTAWASVPSTGPAVVVAVVDSGVDSTHEDLAGRVLPGFNVFDSTRNAMDDAGHGTHVSGTIAATFNNTLGVAGVAGPANVRILPVKVLDAAGSGSYYTVANGIEWAADHGAHIINLSLGGGRSNVVQDAVLYAERKGVVVIAAAGNTSQDTESVSPASAPGVVTVAALDRNDAPAPFSNHGDQVDLIAPGVDILSTVPGNLYQSMDGTSMAAPHVAGLAALLKAVHPAFTRWEIQACLFATAARIVQPASYGYGVPMADRLLACDPTQLDSEYALKLEGPDPDASVYGATAFSFDVKPGSSRLVIKDSTGAERGSTQLPGAGVATVTANLSGLALGAATLTATLTDRRGAVIAAHAFPVMIAPPPMHDIGLALSPTDFNPADGKMKITTRLSGSTQYNMAVYNDQDQLVKWLARDQRYIGPVFWDGKDQNGKMLPEGAYVMQALTSDSTAIGEVDFALRLPPTPGTPTLKLAARAVNVPTVGVSGKVNPRFEVEAQVKTPGSKAFTSIGVLAMAGSDGTFAAPLPLTGGEGMYEVQIRGVDPFDHPNASRWTSSAKVLYDATAPVVTLKSPAPAAGVILTNKTRLALTGTTEPGATVTASVGTSTKTAIADTKGGWKADLALLAGTDSLVLSAVDPTGNHSAEQRFGVVLDTTAPALIPDSLTLVVGASQLKPQVGRGTYGFATKVAPQYLLVGDLSERIDKVVPSHGRLDASIGPAGTGFTVDLTRGLKNGNTTLSFDIYDMAGNKTKLSVAVTVDGTKPTVTIAEKDLAVAPKPNPANAGALLPVPVTYTVSASEPLQALQVLADMGGVPVVDPSITVTPSADRRKWTVNGSLPPADANWTLQFVGVDLAGNVGQLDSKARRRVWVDGTAPDLSLNFPTVNVPIFSTLSSLTITGTAVDEGAGVKSVTVGKSTVRLTNGSFSAMVTLGEGKLTAIPVVGLDNAGNAQTKTVRVVRKSAIGTLFLDTPTIKNRQLSITGRTDAPIALPDGPGVVIPLTVKITDSSGAFHLVDVTVRADGKYAVTVDTAAWAAGNCTILVTAGAPVEFPNLKARTASQAFRIK